MQLPTAPDQRTSLLSFLFFCFLMFTTQIIEAQNLPPKHSRVKVYLQNNSISKLAELGLDYDHGVFESGKYWINDVSSSELKKIKESGFTYRVLIEDVGQWYVEQNNKPVEATARNNQNCDILDISSLYETPSNYTDGSMGGYPTYAELLEILDDMQAKFPQFISTRQPIGDHLTHEGRPIYWVKVGSNPTIDEEKPASFLTIFKWILYLKRTLHLVLLLQS